MNNFGQSRINKMSKKKMLVNCITGGEGREGGKDEVKHEVNGT